MGNLKYKTNTDVCSGTLAIGHGYDDYLSRYGCHVYYRRMSRHSISKYVVHNNLFSDPGNMHGRPVVLFMRAEVRKWAYGDQIEPCEECVAICNDYGVSGHHEERTMTF